MVKKKVLFILIVEFLVGYFPQYSYVIPTSGLGADGNCYVLSSFAKEWLRYLASAMVIVVQFLIPFFSLIYLYSHMAVVLNRQKGTLSSEQHDEDAANAARSRKIKHAQMNLLQTCVIVSIFYCICWMPNMLYFVVFQVSMIVG